MRYVLQSVVSDRGNQMPWKGLSIKHQTFDRYQRLISIFLTNPKDVVVTIVFLEATLLFSQKDIKKTRYLCKHASFKYFQEYWKNTNWPVFFLYVFLTFYV